MVKNILSIIISAILLAAAAVYENLFIKTSFFRFEEQLETLYAKTENETATSEDAEAVKMSWDKIKSQMHILIPHGDISYIDYWLDEATGLIYVKDYSSALPKITVLIDICSDIPYSYAPNAENIF